ncbi:hypothetical protein J5N97_025868 [Dioscorea zingiberensis]|uniref:Uncharacterized protein n=1 Tax=Dioscorea zingiberensis TaxID=325984 RepID=A0A9D5C1A3_9LILI|nr:hypothetical protein J5N97_025868 [Dioscorea zingiberensis]
MALNRSQVWSPLLLFLFSSYKDSIDMASRFQSQGRIPYVHIDLLVHALLTIDRNYGVGVLSRLGLRFKAPSLKISNDRQNSFSLNYEKLFTTGLESKRKGINVVTPNTPLSRKLELLDAYEDEYDGAIIDAECLPASANAFAAILQSSLSYWKQKSGFIYHHAEPGYVMLTCWLPDEPCMLPFTATHQVGVGAFVINENKEVLVVKEKKCPLRCLGIWKLPTGLINKIETAFLEVVCFQTCPQCYFLRSQTCSSYACSSHCQPDINIDESEIEAAMVLNNNLYCIKYELLSADYVCVALFQWMPLDQLIDQPFHREDSMTKNMIDICVARYENRYRGLNPHRIMSKFDDRLATLYYGYLEMPADNGVLNEPEDITAL